MNRKTKDIENVDVFKDDDKQNNNTATETATTRKKRPVRKGINDITILNYPKRKGYVRRVVNDTEGRIDKFKDNGWTPVMKSDMEGGDNRVGADSQMGTPVMRSVGGGIKGVLMEIPEDWYKEDQLAKKREVDRSEDGLKKQNLK